MSVNRLFEIGLILAEVDIGQGEKGSDRQRPVDDPHEAEYTHAADDREQHQQRRQLRLNTDESGFEQVIDGEGEHKIKDHRHQSLPTVSLQIQNERCRQQDQAHANNWHEGGHRHDRPPEDGRDVAHSREIHPAADALNETAEAVADENGPGYCRKFADKKSVLGLRQRREFDHKLGQAVEFDQQEKNAGDQDAKLEDKTHDVGGPG